MTKDNAIRIIALDKALRLLGELCESTDYCEDPKDLYFALVEAKNGLASITAPLGSGFNDRLVERARERMGENTIETIAQPEVDD
jgi:hypothetical protein